MEQYNVTGMSCAACQARVEKAVSSVPGVDKCAVSLLTNSMGVEGSASPEEIILAVRAAGYDASVKNGNAVSQNREDSLKDTETPVMKKRLIASVVLLIPLMYVSMGHMMWNWPIPIFLQGNHVAMGLYELLLSGLIMVINQKFFISGFKGLIHRSPNMDTLVALGSTASFAYSVVALFAMTKAMMLGDSAKVMYYMNQFYFESAAMILTLITVGKMLEAKSKGKTTDALKALMKLSPKTAVIKTKDGEKEVDVQELKVGDIFAVKPGESIPADGIVIEGESAVNEASLTGESIPVEKGIGDRVSTATINTSGYLICEAKRVGEDTTLSEIIKMVSDAAATKAPIAKIADKVSLVFVPTVIGISIITFLAWIIAGQSMGYAIARAVSVLVISCPCALGLATPVAIMVGNGVAARNGILFKTASSLEQAGRTQIVALDKTGTITTGEMAVTDVIPASGISEAKLLEVAYALEMKSEHPISKAVTEYAAKKNINLCETSEFEIFPGNGIKAKVGDESASGGNPAFIKKLTKDLSSDDESAIEKLSKEGKTAIMFEKSGEFLGIMGISDMIKADSKAAISELKDLGIHVVMLTGDNEITANAIAKEAGVDEVVASVKPEGKERAIKKLMEHGKVTMVGDGINDAPALTAADLGIAIGAGTDIAIDAADVVLVKSSIRDVGAAIRISRHTLKNIHENLFWAFFYNCLGIPLAAGCYVKLFGWTLNPMFGAAAMGLSSFFVVTNALRLNLVKPYDNSKDRASKNALRGRNLKTEQPDEKNSEKTTQTGQKEEIYQGTDKEMILLKEGQWEISQNGKEKKEMKITVNGMMCGHCEAHVVKAIMAIDGIESVVASHENNLVTITSVGAVNEASIKAAVEDAGYEYAGIIEA